MNTKIMRWWASRVQCQTDTKFFGIKKNLQWHMRLFDIRNFMIQHWCSGFVRYSTAFSSCFDPWTKSLMEFSDGTRFFTLFYSGCRAKGVFLQPFYGSERFKPSIDAKEYCVTYFSFLQEWCFAITSVLMKKCRCDCWNLAARLTFEVKAVAVFSVERSIW